MPTDGFYERGQVEISWPIDNIGDNLPALMTAVCGNLSELTELSGIRLLEIGLPSEFVSSHPGPAFGIGGTRRLASVEADRPVIGTIVKPSVGLTPEQTADLVRELGMAGLDFIKDDELISNPPWSPLERRVEAVMRAAEDVAESTGRKPMFAFNITDEPAAMRRNHDLVQAAGGTCVMVSVNTSGLAAVAELRRTCELPIHGHRNGFGMLHRHPMLGMEFAAYQVFWRLAGVDHLHVCALQQRKFWESDESVSRSIQACLEPLAGVGAPILPAVSCGQWGGQAPATYEAAGGVDVLYLAGGGILAHPSGPAAGVTAIRDAWKAAVLGVELDEYAGEHPELAASLEAFGER